MDPENGVKSEETSLDDVARAYKELSQRKPDVQQNSDKVTFSIIWIKI